VEKGEGRLIVAVVRVRGALKAKAGGLSEQTVEGTTVAEVLRGLEGEHPDVRGWILDERGTVRRHINVFVNGEIGGVDTPVADEDRIDVLPAISGG
jgi:molybdopterin converting factor small subunit